MLILGILVFSNILSSRYYRRYDFTKRKIHSLSEQTKKVLGSLGEEVEILAFYREGDERRELLKSIIDMYRLYSKNIKLRLIDPDKEPLMAKKYNITTYGTLVFVCGNRTISENPFGDPKEEDITNGIIRVVKERRKKIYFVYGHGEHDIDDTSPKGYYQIKREMEKRGFSVDGLVLLRKGKIPEDASLIVLSGPTRSLLKKEMDMIYEYWKNGGSLLIMLDPYAPKDVVSYIEEKWAVRFDNDVIVDPVSKLFGGNVFIPIATDYPSSPITDDFNLATFFPISRSLSISPDKKTEDLNFTCLAKTNEGAWGERDFNSKRIKFDENDYKGPLNIGYLVTSKKYGGKVVFYGDSDFPANSFMNLSGNKDLFLRTVSYLVEEKELVSITPKEEENTPLYLTSSQSRILFLTSVVFIPLAFALLGLFVWLRRRSL